MRNFKSTIRSTRNSALLFSAASGLLYLTACSSDVYYDAPNENITESNVTIGNDPAAQAHRITFFGNTNPGTRAAELDNIFPVIENEPSSFSDNLTPFNKFEEWSKNNLGSYVIPETYWGSNQITVNGEVYVTGKVNFTGDEVTLRGSGTIYVLNSGSFDLTNKTLKIENGVTLKYYNDINVHKDLKVDNGGCFLTNKNVTVDGVFYAQGITVADKITVEGQLKFDGGTGKVKGRCIYINSDDGQAVNLSQGGLIAVQKYFLCSNLYIGNQYWQPNSSALYLWPNAFAEVTGTTAMCSQNSKVVYYSENQNDGQALLKTGKFHMEGSADDPSYFKDLFSGSLKICYDSFENCEPQYTNDFPDSANDYPIPADPCGATPATDEPTFTPIAIITPPDQGPTHTHNHLSATCVKDVNGRAYVSYHLNAEYEDNKGWADTSEHMGCVEIYDVDENQAQITSWLMNQDFDFNHLLVDDNKVYTVGDTKKFGATLGLINLGNNGNFGQYEMDTEGREGIMTYYKLYGDKEQKGSSGNCIIRDNNTFRIASYNGFQSFGVNDLTKQTDFISTSGSAKHVAKGGNYIVTLNLDQKKVEASTATVTVYSTWGNTIITFPTNQLITPIDGKNVIATDDEYIYVALGEKGVDKYNMGGTFVANYCWITEKLEEDPLYKGKPLANGLCVDDKYVYVANGAAGMIVLDKTTMKRVARYVRSTKVEENGEDRNFSANYVQKVTRDGVDYLYIAYGRNGLEVVKMTAPAK